MAYSHVVADLGGIGNHLGVVGEEAVIESDLIVAREKSAITSFPKFW